MGKGWKRLCDEAGAAVHQCMLKDEGHFYVCGSARQVPEDIYTAMKEARNEGASTYWFRR